MQASPKKSNGCVIEELENKERGKKIFEKRMANYFPNLTKAINLQT